MAVLIKAKEKRLISELRPIFIKLIDNRRYYSLSLLNEILQKNNEAIIEL
ncbi:MAG: DUF3368 domain-containing protein [Endomicrobium sp.]|nr:DUF3368 domain-containing protein [Endomicrobium sp.]